ncbi:MAG: Polysaccharide pyruvyl transferase [Lentisphaerae bacterium ADurb.Bin242]|nr:MAG: Polysaccharide pyruvyl transferase [Lentisphaerae bacterium ADurb.Bin242]
MLWGVGMDSELNPAFYRVRGRRKQLLSLASAFCLRSIDFVEKYEDFLASRTRKRLADILKQCLLVVVRDPQTALELSRCGFHNAVIGADSAILLRETPQDQVVREPGIHRIGFCISAQRQVEDISPLTALLDRLLADDSNRIVFIPMNPKTDHELMDGLRAKLKRPDHAFLLENCPEPGRVQSVAANCDVVVSSRLHLLILAANAGTPIVGISRGSKVDNFLSNFGLTPAGTVRNCDFNRIYENVMSFRDNAAAFRKTAAEIHQKLLNRLSSAEHLLREAVGKNSTKSGGES